MEAANGFMASTITLRIGSSKPEGPAASATFCRSSTVRSWAKRERLAGRTIRASNSLNDFMAEEDIIRAGDFHTRQALSFVIPKARSAEEPAYIQLVGSGEGSQAADSCSVRAPTVLTPGNAAQRHAIYIIIASGGPVEK